MPLKTTKFQMLSKVICTVLSLQSEKNMQFCKEKKKKKKNTASVDPIHIEEGAKFKLESVSAIDIPDCDTKGQSVK